MSHFSVLVRIPARAEEAELEAWVESALAPYDENPDEDADDPKKYFSFVDDEDEYRKKYENDKTTRIRLADGALVSDYDKQFRNPEYSPFKFDAKVEEYIYPGDSVKLELPLKEVFATFEQYMDEYCGYKERDARHRRYGHWSNPDAKWDWWEIGGRFQNRLRVKGSEAGVNYCRGSSLDLERYAKENQTKIREFFEKYEQLSSGAETTEPFEGTRETGLKVGLIDCVDQSQLTGNEWRKNEWPANPANPRTEPRYDVFKEPNDASKKAVEALYSGIGGWAVLGADGWKQCGNMGWWGMSDANESSVVKFAAEREAWLQSGDPEDWIVIVDCHV